MMVFKGLPLGAKDPVQDFCERHHLLAGPSFDKIKPIIGSVSRALAVLIAELTPRTDSLDTEKDELWAVLLVMLTRIHRHVEAALVAITTESPQSSVALSRTIIELSINLLYILRDEREKESWVRYCNAYLIEEEKRLLQWEKAANELDPSLRAVHMKAIANKKSLRRTIHAILETGLLEINAPPLSSTSPWPNAFERFNALGQNLIYRTYYSTLSSEVHGDAAEAVEQFAVISTGQEKYLQLFEQALYNDQELSLSIAISFYLAAAGRYAQRFGLREAVSEIEIAQRVVQATIRELLAAFREDGP